MSLWDDPAFTAATDVERPPTVEAEPDALPPSQIHTGQPRMAYRLAERYADRLLHVHGIGWHVYDGYRWTADDRGMSKRAVLAEIRRAWNDGLHDADLARDARKCDSAAGVAGVLDIGAALEQFAATADDLDADPYMLNVANGTLDLQTRELRPHRPADRITKRCRGAYREGASAPTWDTFLERVLPDAEERLYLQRIIGLALLGEVREHILPILTGTGANGKGTFYKAVLGTLGDYAATAEPDLFMHREGAHPTGEMDLMGRRLVAVSESDKDRRLAEATMKRLTGGDPIRARRMRQDFVEFMPSHTALLITNHLPRVSGDDPAIWRRLRVVPFGVVIPEEERDGSLDAKLELEADGILTWAINGLADYLEHGLREPESVRVATDSYQRSSDAVARFIADRCALGPAFSATTGDLHEAWVEWQQQDGCDLMGLRAFGEALTKKGFQTKAANGKRWRRGIRVKDSTDFEADDADQRKVTQVTQSQVHPHAHTLSKQTGAASLASLPVCSVGGCTAPLTLPKSVAAGACFEHRHFPLRSA